MEKTSCGNTAVSMAPCQLITPCPQYPTNCAEQGMRTGEQAGEHAEPGKEQGQSQGGSKHTISGCSRCTEICSRLLLLLS